MAHKCLTSFHWALPATLKGNSIQAVPSVQNIATLFLEFQLESFNLSITMFTWPKVTKIRCIIATVLWKCWYMCILLTIWNLLKNNNVTSKVHTELKDKAALQCLHFPPLHCLMDKNISHQKTNKKDICFYNKPFCFIFSILLYAHLLLRFLLLLERELKSGTFFFKK